MLIMSLESSLCLGCSIAHESLDELDDPRTVMDVALESIEYNLSEASEQTDIPTTNTALTADSIYPNKLINVICAENEDKRILEASAILAELTDTKGCWSRCWVHVINLEMISSDIPWLQFILPTMPIENDIWRKI